jgi:predicted acetyltransferase
VDSPSPRGTRFDAEEVGTVADTAPDMDRGELPAGYAIRLLGPADADASTRMSTDAFGAAPAGTPSFTLGEGLWRWGLFDVDTLAAKANDRAYQSMIGGRAVPTSGVAGGAVAPEYRGRGLARAVMLHLLRAARDRGAAICTLFRTAPALYRSLGFEHVAELRYVEVPATALAGLRVPDGITLRRAEESDVGDARSVYAIVAAEGSCLLTRSGQSFPETDAAWLQRAGQTTVALDAGGNTVGYVSWHRGVGYGAGASLTVTDLQALTGDAYTALLAMLGSFSSVTPVVRFPSSGTDPLSWFVPGGEWSVAKVEPYLLRVLDAGAAVAARGWPTGLTGSSVLALDDAVCPWNSGAFRLEVDRGQGRLAPLEGVASESRGGSGADVPVRLGPRALALLYAGGVAPATLRRAGLVTGGSAADDAFLAAAFAGPQPAILDYF